MITRSIRDGVHVVNKFYTVKVTTEVNQKTLALGDERAEHDIELFIPRAASRKPLGPAEYPLDLIFSFIHILHAIPYCAATVPAMNN